MSSQTPNSNRHAGYEDFFGLKTAPFSLAPDPRFLFAGHSHSAALNEVAYAIDRREPIVVVTGEIGTGKTLLCRTVLQRLPRQVFVSVVDDPLLQADELLTQLLRDFGVISPGTSAAPSSRHDLVQALHAFFRSLAVLHAHAVVIVDEAQHLRPEVLEQLRLLSNVDDEQGTLMQIVLVGQTDVEPLLARPELRQIAQRITRRFRLEPLTHDEVRDYIEHRLARAHEGASSAPGAAALAQALSEWDGWAGQVTFEPAAIDLVADVSGGVPRVVNLVCDRALESAFAGQSHVVSAAHVESAVRALGMGDALPTPQTAGAPPARRTPDAPFWAATHPQPAEAGTDAPAPQPADARDDVLTAALGEVDVKRRTTSWTTIGLTAVLVAIAAAFGWVELQRRATRVQSTRPAVTAPVAPTTTTPRRSATPAQPPPPPPPAPAPAASPPAADTQASKPAAASPPAAPAESGFIIVVASFRTEARAAEVEGAVTKLGLPARRRVLGGWQQVVCGPFQARSAAEEAQRALAKGGFGGTQISIAGQ